MQAPIPGRAEREPRLREPTRLGGARWRRRIRGAKEPEQFVSDGRPQGAREFLVRHVSEGVRRLGEMTRNEEPEAPRAERAKQFGMPVQKGTKVQRALARDQIRKQVHGTFVG